jgi:CHASE2 domain-containing sensor protein
MSPPKPSRPARKRRPHPPAAAPGGHPAAPPHASHPWWRDLAVGALVILLMFPLQRWAEQTSIGESIRLATYDWLQSRLSSGRRDPLPPVVVLDISDLPPSASVNAAFATPRDDLKALVQAIARQGPRAIGIDISFSPDEHGWITPDDPTFFDFCLNLRQNGRKIPVFLGISQEAQGRPPDEWLGSEDYEPLAASIQIPRKDPRRMVQWFEPEPAGAALGRCRSMGEALAEASRHAEMSREAARNDPSPLRRIVSGVRGAVTTTFDEQQTAQVLRTREFLVDYSLLEDLLPPEDRSRPPLATLRTAHPDEVTNNGWLFKDKIVLIGDATVGKAKDTFVVPGRPEPVPGVLIHACAAYTLAKAPLYELKPWSRVCIDIFLAGLILSLATGLRLYYRRRKEIEVPERGPHQFLTGVALVVILLVGVGWVRWTRVMWDDIPLVIAALWLHYPFSQFLESSAWPWVRDRTGRFWYDRVLEQSEESHP